MFAFYPLAFSFAAFPWPLPSQPDSCSAVCGRRRIWSFWEGKYSSFLRLQQGEREAGQLAALVDGWRVGGRLALYKFVGP